MLMSAPTTLVIQMPLVLTLLDPSSVLVRKDLLKMIVTAQVWNSNVTMEGHLSNVLLSPSSYSLLLLLPFPLITQYCYSQIPTFKHTPTSLTPILIFTTSPSSTSSYFLHCYYSFFTQIVISLLYFLPYYIYIFLYLTNWYICLAKEYL